MNQKRYLIIMGIMVVVVLLLVSSCTGNRWPVITSLEGEAPGWAAPLGSLHVTCNASDPEGDVLSYGWSAGGGDISGTGAIVNWTAPEEVGMYDITVVVRDSQGANATGTITLIASNGPPPVIEDVLVTADHKYLKEAVIGYKVGKAQDYHLACNASDPEDEELSYQWTCTAGNISGGSSNITWTAPDASGDVTVTVKVFDETGNWVRRSIFFEVVPCSPCTFG